MERRNSAVAIHLLFSLWRVFRAEEMSALCQKRTFCAAVEALLFDYLVSSCE